MENFLKHYIYLFEFVLSHMHTQLKDIPMLSDVEKKEILTTYAQNNLPYPSKKNILQLFEEQVDKTPHAIAIWYQDEKLTYQELKQKVNHFSYYFESRYSSLMPCRHHISILLHHLYRNPNLSSSPRG